MAAEVVFFFLGKRSKICKTSISVITNQSCSQNSTALYLNLLIMTDHNDYDCNEILSEYWCTDTPSNALDDSGDSEDKLIDLIGIFIAFIMEHVVCMEKPCMGRFHTTHWLLWGKCIVHVYI